MAWYTDKCERCGEESEHYVMFPRCRDCGSSVCDACTAFGTVYEDEGRMRCQCLNCAEYEEEEFEAFEEDVATVDFD